MAPRLGRRLHSAANLRECSSTKISADACTSAGSRISTTTWAARSPRLSEFEPARREPKQRAARTATAAPSQCRPYKTPRRNCAARATGEEASNRASDRTAIQPGSGSTDSRLHTLRVVCSHNLIASACAASIAQAIFFMPIGRFSSSTLA